MALPPRPKRSIPKGDHMPRPFTFAFNVIQNEAGEIIDLAVIGKQSGIRTFVDFPDEANILNVCHKNGRTTVIKK